MTARTFIVNVTQPGSALSWFTGLAYNTWTPIAGGSGYGATWQNGSRFMDVFFTPDTSSPTQFFIPWVGAGVDPNRKELLMVANGGHSDGNDNGGYALQLNQSVPAWRRLSNPTPREYWLSNPGSSDEVGPGGYYDPFTAAGGDYADRIDGPGTPATEINYGRMRATHTWNRVQFCNGRMWWAGLDSMACSSGAGWNGTFSWDRDWVSSQGGDSTPIAHSVSNPLPFRYHGLLPTSSVYLPGGVAITDAASNRIFTFHNGSASGIRILDTTTGTVTSHAAAASGNQYVGLTGGMAGAVASNLSTRIGFVTMRAGTSNGFVNTFYALDCSQPTPASGGALAANSLKKLTMGGSWSMGTGSSGDPLSPNLLSRSYGCVYHPQSKTFLMFEPSSSYRPDVIFRVNIPLAAGNYDPAGTWTITEVAKAGHPTLPAYGGSWRGMYSKFNIIPDMGNGEACLVSATSATGPVYVMRLSNAGV